MFGRAAKESFTGSCSQQTLLLGLVHTSRRVRLVRGARQIYRFLLDNRPGKIDTYDLRGRQVASIAKYGTGPYSRGLLKATGSRCCGSGQGLLSPRQHSFTHCQDSEVSKGWYDMYWPAHRIQHLALPCSHVFLSLSKHFHDRKFDDMEHIRRSINGFFSSKPPGFITKWYPEIV